VESFLREQGKGRTALSCPSTIRLYEATTGEAIDMPCKRRTCSACGPQRWRPRTMAKLHSGLAEPDGRYLVLLLTAPGNVTARSFNSLASFYWNRFWTSAARYWPGLDYWKVAELQQRGHIHFHVIVRGIDFIDIEKFRRLAVRSGFGSFVGVARPSDYPGGVKGAAGYLSKYLLKDYQRNTDGPRFVTMSRGWPTLWREPVKRASRSSWMTYYELRRIKMLASPVARPPLRSVSATYASPANRAMRLATATDVSLTGGRANRRGEAPSETLFADSNAGVAHSKHRDSR